MPKKNNDSGSPPLAHHWMPPETLIESGVGQPWACIATTFEFNADFFETELLPRFLGLKFDHTENEPSFLVEREEALAPLYGRVAVLVDQSRFDSTQSTMRWDQILIQVPAGILHAKITLLAWQHFLRVILGSANLTRAGYRRNREVFAALDFWNDSESVPLRVLHDTLDFLTLTLNWSRVAPAVHDRTSETIALVRQSVRNWTSAPEEFTPRQRPRVALAATHPANGQRAARSTLAEIVESWGNRRATSISVVTPFVGQHTSGDSRDLVIDKLMEVPRSRECEGWLVVPELPKTADQEQSHVCMPRSVGQAWSAAFNSPRAAYVLPLPLCVKDKEDRNRDLHSKSILLENGGDTLMMIGSSNFTPHGMGIGCYNVEANLIFEDQAGERRNGLSLGDRLQLPLDWDDAVDATEVVWLEPAEPPEDAPDPNKVLPPFFTWATYSQQTGELKLSLDRTTFEPAAWSVRLPGAGKDSGTALFARNALPETLEATILSHTFQEDARGVNIVALVVEWTDPEGQRRQARLGVGAESMESLLPPTEYRKLGADAIIECLMSGKSPSQWYDQQQNAIVRGSRNDAAIESLRSVDTSGYLLYRVRRFGQAITGMCERISRTVPHPAAIRYRLLRDPFGPVSLATTLLSMDAGKVQGWCTQLEREHRVFLLTEILLAVSHLRPRFYKQAARGKGRKEVMAQFDEAEKQLAEAIDKESAGDGLPANLRAYVEAVRSRTSQQSSTLTAGEVEDAG
jgi:hypothetical protein